jgi:hypothetical protein
MDISDTPRQPVQELTDSRCVFAEMMAEGTAVPISRIRFPFNKAPFHRSDNSSAGEICLRAP